MPTTPEYQAEYRQRPGFKAKNLQWQKNYAEKRKKIVMETIGDCCCKCGSKEKLEVDHINPALLVEGRVRRGFKMTQKELEEEKDNLQVLCRPCHLERTAAQHAAAWKLFISLPLEEQERLMYN